MKVEGWKEFTPDEERIFRELGSDVLFRAANSAFDYGYWHGRIMEIPYNSAAFYSLNDMYREKVCRRVVDAINKSGRSISVTFPSDEKVKEEVAEGYRRLLSTLDNLSEP